MELTNKEMAFIYAIKDMAESLSSYDELSEVCNVLKEEEIYG